MEAGFSLCLPFFLKSSRTCILSGIDVSVPADVRGGGGAAVTRFPLAAACERYSQVVRSETVTDGAVTLLIEWRQLPLNGAGGAVAL